MQVVKPYVREARYYETDQMRVIHHSNYIRWFEEARIDYLYQLGIDFAKLENEGIVSPLLNVNIEYKSMTKFKDLVEIIVNVESFSGVRVEFSYEIRDLQTKEIKAIGSTKHCFLNKDGKIISLKREKPEFYAIFINQCEGI